jgi:uncharacterized protein (DUF1800 family)
LLLNAVVIAVDGRGMARTTSLAAPTRGVEPTTTRRRILRTSAKPVSTAHGSSAAFTQHLLNRATFTGATPQAVAAVAAAGGPQAWLAKQLAPVASADAALDTALGVRFPLAHASAPYVWANTQGGSWDAGLDLARWTLGKACWSKNQLFEVMCEFWSNHLNIPCPTGNAWATKGDNDTQVIRAHAFGRFDDMLAASVISPGMLESLTNVDNTKSAPDENLGREIMELHSVGVNAGYGQAGVVASSRVFTGLSVWYSWNGGTAANLGTLRNSPSDHYVGPIQVLTWKSANADATAAPAVAQDFARYLAHHPDTANRIATKLAIRFVSDTPPASLVSHLASVYTAHQTAIVPVLQALFASPEFAASAGQKYRRPIEDMAATVSALGWTLDPTSTSADGFGDLYWQLWAMGQAPLNWPAPDGYPDVSGAWVGTGVTLSRWNTHLALAAGWIRDGMVQPALAARVLPSPVPTTRSALCAALLSRFANGSTVSAAQVAALVTYLGGPGAVDSQDVGWKLPYLVGLALDAPQWSAR